MTFASLSQEQSLKYLIATAAVIRNFRKILEDLKWGSVKGIHQAAPKMKKSFMENFIFCAVRRAAGTNIIDKTKQLTSPKFFHKGNL